MESFSNHDDILKHLLKIELNMKCVNKFACIPFFILLPYLFIALPAFVKIIMNAQHLIFLLTISSILYFLCIIIPVVMAIIFERKLESQKEKIISKILSSNETSMTIQWRICLDKLSDTKLFNFSVLSLFSIDFNLLTALTCGIISLSILFFQFDSEVYQANVVTKQ